MAIKDLGPVTAYAYAVQGGYIGTEQEFTDALGQAGITLAELEGLRAVATTLAEGSQATASYSDGVLTLGIPRGATGSTGAKGDTGDKGETGNGIESIELTATVGKVKTYTITFTDGTTTTFDVTDGEVTEDSLAEVLKNYAEINGYYDEMTAGSAEQLLSTQFVEDSVPYNFRTSGGSKDIGDRELDEIVGGTIAWNQLVTIPTVDKSFEKNGITGVDNRDGSYSFSGTATATTYVSFIGQFQNRMVNGHKYIVLGMNNKDVYLNDSYSGKFDTKANKVFAYSNANNARVEFGIKVENGAEVNETIKPQMFDLTLMFGITIAGHVYSLEQAEAGKGVTFFKSLFPKDYYEYNGGEQMSVKTSAHEMVGFNQWDEEWVNGYYNQSNGEFVSNANFVACKNKIPVFPNTAYFVNINAIHQVLWYDANEQFISANTSMTIPKEYTSPANARYMAFYIGGNYGTTYKGDACINLSWSGWRNGEYEHYVKHTYPLSPVELRGIPKLDANNNLCYEGDTYAHDGTVTRKYGVKQMTASYLRGLGESMIGYYATPISYIGSVPSIWVRNFLYPQQDNSVGIVEGGCKVLTNRFIASCNNTQIFSSQYRIYLGVGSNITSVADFIAYVQALEDAGSGLYVVYELAEPTEETATPYDEVQLVDDFGTERYVDERAVAIPVGHNTKYPANLRDKLQHLPDLADVDGAYLIRQTNKKMTLDLFRIPKAPTTDGTYTLKATVSGGTPTYTWEAENE